MVSILAPGVKSDDADVPSSDADQHPRLALMPAAGAAWQEGFIPQPPPSTTHPGGGIGVIAYSSLYAALAVMAEAERIVSIHAKGVIR